MLRVARLCALLGAMALALIAGEARAQIPQRISPDTVEGGTPNKPWIPHRPPRTSGGFMGIDVGGIFLLSPVHQAALDAPVNFGLHFGYELPFGLAPITHVEYSPMSVKPTSALGKGKSAEFGSVTFGARYIYRNYHKYWFWLAPWAGLEMGFSIFGLSGGYPDPGNPSYNFVLQIPFGIDFRVARNFWIGPLFKWGRMFAGDAAVNTTYLQSSCPPATAVCIAAAGKAQNLDAFFVQFSAHLLF
jgi:hypothetical protein